MIIKEFDYLMKDGRNAHVRSPREEDVTDVLDLVHAVASETHFLMNYPEECDRYTPEGEKALFERVNSSEYEAMLLCLVATVRPR